MRKCILCSKSIEGYLIEADEKICLACGLMEWLSPPDVDDDVEPPTEVGPPEEDDIIPF